MAGKSPREPADIALEQVAQRIGLQQPLLTLAAKTSDGAVSISRIGRPSWKPPECSTRPSPSSWFVSGTSVVVAAFEFDFMGGSMGSVVGERFVRGVRVAYESRVPFVCVTASGGARMQEGVNSLFQMAKTTAVLQELNKARLPFVTMLTDPTMGGVSASFAFVADLVLAEPGALIGFAGPRVIEQTVREKLPEGFQRAEFLMEKGALDLIIDRRQLRDELAALLSLLSKQPAPT